MPTEDETEGENRRFSNFNPDLIMRLQHSFYLFIGMIICTILKGTHGHIFSGKLSILTRGCESIHEQKEPSGKGGGAVDLIIKYSEVINLACYDNTVVYRVSFSLAFFFFLHFISVSDLTCCIDSTSRAKMQTKFNCMKGIILLLIMVVSFFIPNPFFAYYAWVCMFVSAIFLIVQIIILIDWSHEWNDKWGDRAEENSKWHIYLFAIVIVSYCFGIAMTVVNFYYFVPAENCNTQGFTIIAVLISGIVFTLISIWVPHGSIVPSGIVFGYTSLVCFTTLQAVSDSHCNRLGPTVGKSFQTMLLTSLFSSVLLAWSVVSAGGSRGSLTLATEEELQEEDPDESGHLAGYCYFYIVMMMGSMYLSMMVTNWQVSGNGKNGEIQGETISFWVKISTIGLTIMMYLWTLLAPYFCCKHRDYGFDTTWE
eukprot:Tbor_TRINITY_DN5690_c4_g3::TRINITY_DN5690_c4_g3_i1::g.9366::m.9366